MGRLLSRHRWFLLALCLWTVFTSVIIHLESRIPGTDVFLFKEAGVNLALKGRFVVSNFPHMTIDEERVYAYYPPIYPLLFGIWSWVLGVGLKQSILFDSILRAIRSLLLLFFILPTLNTKQRSKEMPVLGALLLVLSFLSSDGDRPDELAMIWGLASWYFMSRSHPQAWQIIFSAILLGLCAATSPAGGLIFAMGVVFFCLRQRSSLLMLSWCGGVSAFTFLFCNLPIYLADPLSWDRFSKQLPKSILPYQIPFVGGADMLGFLASMTKPISHSVSVGLPYIFCALGLAIMALAVLLRARPRIISHLGHRSLGSSLNDPHSQNPRHIDGYASDFAQSARPNLTPSCAPKCEIIFGRALSQKRVENACRPFLCVGVLFVPICGLIFTLQPYYLWFSCIVLIVGLIAYRHQEQNVLVRRFVLFGIWLAISPIAYRELKGQAHALQKPASESVRAIQENVLSHIQKSERIVITHDQYFTFRKFREVANVAYICPWVDRFEYLYATPITTQRKRTDPVPNPCSAEVAKCFTLAGDFSSRKVFRVLGIESQYYVRGNGGTLYKNTECTKAIAKRD